MLKLMLIQRNGAITHKIIHNDTEFEDFIEMVSFENFGKQVSWNRQNKYVQVANSNTTYTMLEVEGAHAA